MKYCCDEFKGEYEAGDDFIRNNTYIKYCPYCGANIEK